MKIALVKSIYKSGKKSEINNYRPISMLPIVEKIYEEVIVRRLNSFIKKHKLIHNQQYGFQSGKSINKLLGNFASHLNEAKSKKHHSLILFIDFSKAFDTLNHVNILHRLDQIGIQGSFLDLFKDYLKNRTYKVRISDVDSNSVNVSQGVPQGSKLGTLLYFIYSNQLLELITNTTGFAYADDTAIIAEHKNLDMAIQILQGELDKISEWALDNGLIINVNKTKVMHVLPYKHKNTIISIKCREKACDPSTTRELEVVSTMKYLGVIVGNDLKWRSQIENVRKKNEKICQCLLPPQIQHPRIRSQTSISCTC